MPEKYYCVFDSTQECPVREQFKLQPENLLEFCKLCSKTPIKREPEAEIASFMSVLINKEYKEKEILLEQNMKLMTYLIDLIGKPR